jgi:hypothetical protein
MLLLESIEKEIDPDIKRELSKGDDVERIEGVLAN